MTSYSSAVVHRREARQGQARDWGDVANQATSSAVQAHRAVCREQGAARNRASQVSAAIWPSIAAGVIVALMVAAAGAAMPSSAAQADLDADVQVRVIESDFAEPFVV